MWVCVFLEGLSIDSIPDVLMLLVGKESVLDNINCSVKWWGANNGYIGRSGSIYLLGFKSVPGFIVQNRIGGNGFALCGLESSS